MLQIAATGHRSQATGAKIKIEFAPEPQGAAVASINTVDHYVDNCSLSGDGGGGC